MFKLGDRVRGIRHNFIGNKLGTVCCLQHWTGSIYSTVGVAWDEPNEYFHDLMGKCVDGHGYYVAGIHLEICDEDVGDMEDDL